MLILNLKKKQQTNPNKTKYKQTNNNKNKQTTKTKTKQKNVNLLPEPFAVRQRLQKTKSQISQLNCCSLPGCLRALTQKEGKLWFQKAHLDIYGSCPSSDCWIATVYSQKNCALLLWALITQTMLFCLLFWTIKLWCLSKCVVRITEARASEGRIQQSVSKHYRYCKKKHSCI